MAKKDKELIDALRSGGVRKKVARGLSEAASEAKQGGPSKELTKSVESLRAATSVLEDRVQRIPTTRSRQESRADPQTQRHQEKRRRAKGSPNPSKARYVAHPEARASATCMRLETASLVALAGGAGRLCPPLSRCAYLDLRGVLGVHLLEVHALRTRRRLAARRAAPVTGRAVASP